MVVGYLMFGFWEANLTAVLTEPSTSVPFDGVESLMQTPNYKIFLTPHSAQISSFKYSNIPLWQKAWTERIEPHLDFYEDYINSKQGFLLHFALISILYYIIVV